MEIRDKNLLLISADVKQQELKELVAISCT